MGLGSKNRDYKTGDRGTTRRVLKHIELMNKYIEQGMSKDKASKKAYDEVINMKITGKKL